MATIDQRLIPQIQENAFRALSGARIHSTNLYIDTEKAGLLTVRLFGEYNAEPGTMIYATPEPSRIYRFGADGKVMP